MDTHEQMADALMGAFSAPDHAAREAELVKAVAEDVAVSGPEPQEKFRSREELARYYGEMAKEVPPGTTMVRTTPVHEHDGYVRWRFSFRMPDGTEPYRFEAFGEEREGRLTRVVTFDVSAE